MVRYQPRRAQFGWTWPVRRAVRSFKLSLLRGEWGFTLPKKNQRYVMRRLDR